MKRSNSLWTKSSKIDSNRIDDSSTLPEPHHVLDFVGLEAQQHRPDRAGNDRNVAFAGVTGLAWVSAVWLFQMSEPKRGGGPAKARPVGVSPEQPHLARCPTRP